MSKEQMSKENKKIIVIAVAVIIVIAVVGVICLIVNNGLFSKKVSVDNTTVQNILSNKEEKIIYVENTDEKKCSECKKIKKYLDQEDIVYDVKQMGDKEYTKLLQMLTINKTDFNYPAVLYFKEGIMYSNVINLEDTKIVEQFIKDYNLKNVK